MNLNWSYSTETPNLGHIRRFLAPCDLEILRMTLKNNRAPILSNIKLYVSFHYHMWIQTRVTVRKLLSGVVTTVTLTFDLWPWPFAWTLPWSLVITPENFMMMRWGEHSQNGVPERRTEKRTEPFIKNLWCTVNVHLKFWLSNAGSTVSEKLGRVRPPTYSLHKRTSFEFKTLSIWSYLHFIEMLWNVQLWYNPKAICKDAVNV